MILATVVEPGDEPPRKPSVWSVAFSWFCCIAAIATTWGLAVFIATDRERYRTIFKDFGVDLPWSTKLFMVDPVTMTVVVMVVIVLVIGLQILVRRPHATTTIHILLIAACLAILGGYREAMAGNVLKLLTELGRPHILK
jgi:hypothetical protein